MTRIWALYSSRSDVLQLNSTNFDEVVFSSEHLVIVEFFAPWCGHCKNFAPEYEKVASTLKGMAKVAAVDCHEVKNQPLCAKYDIKGFPTIKLFPKISPARRQGIGK
jgi:protein disulfide-isomerase A6